MVASAIMVPCLSVIFLVVATIGSFIVGVGVLGIDEGAFMARIEWFLDPFDFTHGLYKAIVFGVVTPSCSTSTSRVSARGR